MRPFWKVVFVIALILCFEGVSLSARRGIVPYRKIKVIAILDRNEEGKPFRFPRAVSIDPYTLESYVVDSARSMITIFSPDFFPKLSLGRGRGIFAPFGIHIEADGTFYVCQGVFETRPPRLSVFNGAGILEKEIVFKDLEFEGAKNFYPRSVAADEKFVYVVGEGIKAAVVLEKESGAFVRLIEVRDAFVSGAPKEKASFVDVYVDSNGRLYLLSEEMGRFYVFDALGKFLFKGGIKGGGPGKLARPRGIAASPELGLILVIDYLRHTGLAYEYETGRFTFEFGGRGVTPGWFNYPTDIEVDPSGRIYVADLFNRRVQVFIFAEKEGVVSPTPSFVTPLQKLKE